MPIAYPSYFFRPVSFSLLLIGLAFSVQPQSAEFEPGTIGGQVAVLAGGEDVSLGVGVLPTADAVSVIGRSHQGLMYHSKIGTKAIARKGGITQDELIAMDPEAGVAVSALSGGLFTAAKWGDHRLHVEWLAPGRADGGYGTQTGNSGVYIQGRYEVQILATPSDKPANELEPWEAGSLYKFKPADLNASYGPGEWQAYDIWFRAARFDGQGNKTEDARITVYWNGELIHNDVQLPGPTGSAAKHGEPIGEGETVLTGVLRLQGHFSDGEAPVRFRNVWVAPLEGVDYKAGSAKELFDGQTLDGWGIRGGTAEYRVEDGQIVGTGVPNSGGNTFLVSEQAYGDFELTYEVKTESLNSGVQIRSHIDGGFDQRSGRVRGYQIEADPTDRRYSGGVFEEGRRGWLAPLIDKPYARRAWRAGEWNTITVLARGPRIQTWVNGVPAADLFDAVTARGHIGLQVHGIGQRDDRPEVRFRNLRLRELAPVEAE